MKEYLSTNRQQQRRQTRLDDVARLLELGWVESFPGMWLEPKRKIRYQVRDAISLEQLRGNILRGGNRRKALVRKKTNK